MEKMLLRGVTKDADIARISVVGVPDTPGIAFKIFNALAGKEINVDVILQSIGRNGNKDITGIDSLADKIVATQSGSTGPAILAEFAPDAIVQEFEDDIQARTAVELGRADAYVTDYTLILNSIVKNPGLYQVAGDVFGPVDPYGIGLPKDSDGVAFVNEFLKTIEDSGLWAQLWKISLGDRTGIESVPAAPALAE